MSMVQARQIIHGLYHTIFFYFSHCLSMVGLQPLFSLFTGRMVPLRGIEPFSATLAQVGLAECDQPGKNPLRYSAMAGN